jgi:hypothetical protein
LDEARRILQVLEFCNFQWMPSAIRKEPKELMDALVALKANGERLKTQVKNKEEGKF